jgi:starch-binding outer membrane protein, SusD/RagB family
MKKILLICLSALYLFSSCEDVLEPAIENNLDLDNVYGNALYGQGLLLNAYNRIPANGWSFNDVATDNAVSNNIGNDFRRMATGQWSAISNPLNQWSNSRAAIQYANLFLSVVEDVPFSKDEIIQQMFIDRQKGEAYGLRALFMYHLLETHGGWTASGELLGVPILLLPEDENSDFNVPRATFEACMQQIYADLAEAEKYLPLDFEDLAEGSENEIFLKYSDIDANHYNRVFGKTFRSRFSTRIAKGVRAKAALLAASPAYAAGTTTTMEDVAKYAGEVINLNGGVAGLSTTGHRWYAETGEIGGLANGVNPAEILWRGNVVENNELEADHFPPTLYGRGRLNPTQNLVDAFPMANGYPISDEMSGFDAANPYAGRDPRLALYVLLNGTTAGTTNTVIYTSVDGGTNDGLNKLETSTRTGYYMRKLLRQDINLNPSNTTTQKKFTPRIRYTEVYLIYAEAANEAYGPMGTGEYGFSAYDVIKAIRTRAGVGGATDEYLENVKNDQAAMRDLIRNERRLELCFEGFRFWDLRRWKLNLTEAATGVSIEEGLYNPIHVENRIYNMDMYHGPIPYVETLKFDALIQNKGW